MIVARVTGGLGNQMFQYAAARCLSYVLHTALLLDTEEYLWKKHRTFLLDVFRLSFQIASHEDISMLLGFSRYLPRFVHSRVNSAVPFLFPNVFSEKHFHFDSDFFSRKDPTYLFGFFQSEKYFFPIRHTLRREFTLRLPLSPSSLTVLDAIRHSHSVSLHVRRGDYLSDARNFRRHGVLGLPFYREAVARIKRHVSRPRFFVFSDDPKWAKTHIRLSDPVCYVDFNYPDCVWEDLMLTSYCRHNILANSTFSWWAGWLNQNDEKIVLAPRHWFRDPSFDTRDLFPDSWVLI